MTNIWGVENAGESYVPVAPHTESRFHISILYDHHTRQPSYNGMA